jgi:hypothetical protein
MSGLFVGHSSSEHFSHFFSWKLNFISLEAQASVNCRNLTVIQKLTIGKEQNKRKVLNEKNGG